MDSWQRKFVPTQWELKTVLSGINGRKHEVDHSVPSSACNFNSILLLSSITWYLDTGKGDLSLWYMRFSRRRCPCWSVSIFSPEDGGSVFFLKRLFLPSLPVCVSYTLYQNTFGVNNSFFYCGTTAHVEPCPPLYWGFLITHN
jgi:hypothetical protein